jgi:hypothetical protein
MENWSNAVPPPSVRHQLDDFFDGINPPGSNDAFRAGLRNLQERTEADLASLVECYLDHNLENLATDIQAMSQRDRARAEDIVRRQLRNLRTHGNKLEEALAATRTPVRNNTDQDPPRSDVTKATIPVSNRFDALRNPASHSHNEPMDHQTTPATPSRTSKRPAPPTRSPPPPAVRRRQTSSPAVVGNRLPGSPDTASTVHADAGASFDAANFGSAAGRVYVINKDADQLWNFDTISPPETIRTLVIADSNGRQWRSIPADWQVLAFPGARIQDVDRLLCGINLPASIDSVVLAVGTNNRCDSSTTMEDRIKELHAMATTYSAPLYVVAVPTLDRATPAEDHGATVINDIAARLFGSNYIRLPTGFPVEYTSPTETTHYTHATARRYIDAVKSFLSSKN